MLLPTIVKLFRLFSNADKVVQLPHSPYLLELSPCNICIISKTKTNFDERRYSIKCAIDSAINHCLQSIPVQD